ncbi:MAG: hypothetical protein ACOX6W_09625 [Lentisphaeria bacterium]
MLTIRPVETPTNGYMYRHADLPKQTTPRSSWWSYRPMSLQLRPQLVHSKRPSGLQPTYLRPSGHRLYNPSSQSPLLPTPGLTKPLRAVYPSGYGERLYMPAMKADSAHVRAKYAAHSGGRNCLLS